MAYLIPKLDPKSESLLKLDEEYSGIAMHPWGANWEKIPYLHFRGKAEGRRRATAPYYSWSSLIFRPELFEQASAILLPHGKFRKISSDAGDLYQFSSDTFLDVLDEERSSIRYFPQRSKVDGRRRIMRLKDPCIQRDQVGDLGVFRLEKYPDPLFVDEEIVNSLLSIPEFSGTIFREL